MGERLGGEVRLEHCGAVQKKVSRPDPKRRPTTSDQERDIYYSGAMDRSTQAESIRGQARRGRNHCYAHSLQGCYTFVGESL